jgi:hypothetical protein
MSQSKSKAKSKASFPSSGAPSSPGDSPVEMTPLDVTPEDAAWRDRTARQITSTNAEEKMDALLDEAVELTFPASDPIPTSTGTGRGDCDWTLGTKPGAKG